jgi:hypothetical protein
LPPEAIVMTKLRGVGVGVVFLVGCAVGGASGRFIVPPASAQQASVTRWEYFCFEESRAEGVSEKIAPAGAQGWELVTAGSRGGVLVWCLKRPRM